MNRETRGNPFELARRLARIALQIAVFGFGCALAAHLASGAALAADAVGDGGSQPSAPDGFAPVATVKIVVDSVPDDQQDFPFAATGSGLTAFTLDDDADATLLNSRTFALFEFELGPKSISETVHITWTLASIVCSGDAESQTSVANRSVTLDVDVGEAIVCTFTSNRAAFVQILLDAVPDDPQDFAFTASWTSIATVMDDDGVSGFPTPNNLTFRIERANFGTLTLTQAAIANWTLTSLSCTGTRATTNLATRTASFPVVAGDMISCSFVDAKRAILTINKVTDPGVHPQDFDFDLTGAGLPVDLDLDTDPNSASPASSASFLIPGNLLGPKTITESVTGGWTLSLMQCSGDTEAVVSYAEREITLDVDAGEVINCTFTNKKYPTLRISKVTNPAVDPQDFDFDVNYGASEPADLDLDTDPASSLPSSITVVLLSVGPGSVVETMVPGWRLTNLQCTGDADAVTSVLNRRVDYDADMGEDIVCVFSNEKAASVRITKVTAPLSDPQDFDFDLTGGGLPTDVDLDTDSSSVDILSSWIFGMYSFGAKTITKSSTTGWTLTNLQCTGDTEAQASVVNRQVLLDVDAGETIDCTFTNAKNAQLTIAKATNPASDPQDFDFDLTGTGLPSDLDLDTDGASATLPSSITFPISGDQLGSKAVTESAAAGWALISIECTGATSWQPNVLNRQLLVNVAPGQTIICTFASTKASSVRVASMTAPAVDPQDFAFQLFGNDTLVSPTLDTDPASTTPSSATYNVVFWQLGPWTIREDAVTGWTVTNIQCTGDSEAQTNLGTREATVDIDAGENITCTFTNTKSATVQIYTTTNPSDGQDFDFDLTGAGLPADLDLDEDADPALPSSAEFTITAAQFGTKTITESVAVGWRLDAIDCVGDTEVQTSVVNRRATVDVDAGEVISCAFLNTTDTSLLVVEDSVPDDPQDFDFDATGAAILADFDLDDDDARGLPNSMLFPIKRSELGQKTITQSLVEGWPLVDTQCTGDSEAQVSLANRRVTLDIDGGENVVCIFRNTKSAPVSAQPDGRIRKGATAPFIGDNIYNADGTNQFVQGVKPVGYALKFTISIENDGTAPDQFLVQATGTAVAGYRVKYFVGTTDISAAVVAGTYQTSSLAVGASAQITVKVKVQSVSAIGSSVTRLVTLTSVADTTKHDAVKFTAKRK